MKKGGETLRINPIELEMATRENRIDILNAVIKEQGVREGTEIEFSYDVPYGYIEINGKRFVVGVDLALKEGGSAFQRCKK